jgi:hypothetical protein
MKINKYRKKPVIIEAMQWTKSNRKELYKWAGAESEHHLPKGWRLNQKFFQNFEECIWFLVIPTPEGAMEAMEEDWIIKGVKGEYYPCKPDIFEMTYEEVKDKDDED